MEYLGVFVCVCVIHPALMDPEELGFRWIFISGKVRARGRVIGLLGGAGRVHTHFIAYSVASPCPTTLRLLRERESHLADTFLSRLPHRKSPRSRAPRNEAERHDAFSRPRPFAVLWTGGFSSSQVYFHRGTAGPFLPVSWRPRSLWLRSCFTSSRRYWR